MPLDIILISVARALVEVAGMFLIGQGVLWLFGPRARDGNFVYDLFKKGTMPVMRVTRAITPRIIHDAHIGFVAFFILALLWMALRFWKLYLCALRHLQC